MNIKTLDEKVCDLDGKPFELAGAPLTLRKAITVSLSAQFPEDANLSMEDKIKRYRLARRTHHAKAWTSFPAEDIATMKRLISKNFNPLVTGTCCDMIEGTSEPLPSDEPPEENCKPVVHELKST